MYCFIWSFIHSILIVFINGSSYSSRTVGARRLDLRRVTWRLFRKAEISPSPSAPPTCPASGAGLHWRIRTICIVYYHSIIIIKTNDEQYAITLLIKTCTMLKHSRVYCTFDDWCWGRYHSHTLMQTFTNVSSTDY